MAVVFGVLLALAASACNNDSLPELRAKAQTAFEQRNFRTAEIHLKNLLQKTQDANARTLLGRVYLQRQDWRSAEKEFHSALESGADVDVVGPLLLEALGRFAEPARVLARAAELNPTDARAVALVELWKGRSFARQNLPDKARRAFEQALRSDSSLVDAKVAILGLDAAQGPQAAAQALTVLETTVLTDAPESLSALMLQAELQVLTGQWESARDPLEKMLALTPGNPEVHSRLAEIDIRVGRFDAAHEHIVQALKRAPGWPQALTLKAQVEFQRKEYDQARDSVLLALKTAPEFVPALRVAAMVFLQQGALEQAEGYSRQVVRLAPSSSVGYRLLAATHLRKGNGGQALQAIKPLLDRGSEDPVLFALAGESAMKQGASDVARDYFAKAVNLDQADGNKRLALALAKLSVGDRDGGLADLESAIQLSPDSTSAELALITSLLRDRQFDRALQAIDALAKKGGETGLIANLRGAAFLGKGNRSMAREQFEVARASQSFAASATANLASLDLMDGKAADARKRYDDILARTPNDEPALLGLARLLSTTPGQADEVLGLLRRAHAAHPASAHSALVYAQALVRAGQPKEAVAVLQGAAKQNPEQVGLLEVLAAAHLKAGETQQATEVTGKALRLGSGNAGVQYRMALLKAEMGDSQGALDGLEAARRLQPSAIEPRMALATTYARLKNFDQALKTARAMQADLPTNAAGWGLEGELLMLQSRWKEAVRPLRTALKMQPAQHAIAVRLHQALQRSGSEGEAGKLLAGSLAAHPSDPILNGYAGEIELLAKRYDRAAQYLETVLKVKPADAVAMNNLAWSLHQLKEPRALGLAEEAFRLAPGLAAVVDTLATILGDTAGPSARSLDLHRRSVQLAPRQPDYRLHLARALISAGQKDAARAELDHVLKDFAGSPQANEAKKLLGTL